MPGAAKAEAPSLSTTSAAGSVAALRLHHRHLCGAGGGGAARLLLTGHAPESVGLRTPKGIVVEVAPQFCRPPADGAECAIDKDGGDDVDATTGLPVIAAGRAAARCTAHRSASPAGQGVGRVTKPGLDQPVGAAAINHVPRQMIAEALREAESACYTGGFAVTISIEGGEAAAKRTFNPHIGVEGGLSVLGTSGIVEPMSQQATPGYAANRNPPGRAEKPAPHPGPRQLRAGLSGTNDTRSCTNSRRKISNFVGDALDMAAADRFAEVLLVGHVGKLVKLAGGIMNTHSRSADCRTELFCAHAALCGADAATCPP